ncbi:MAG: ATP-dependent DNA ligase [Planctomycetota bacterium]
MPSPAPDVSADTLSAFAVANDAAAATTKKLEKQSALAGYFRTLGEDDLARAVRFAGGRAFAETDERVVGVSGRTFGDVAVSVLGLDRSAWRLAVIRNGEVGEALASVWQQRDGDPLVLADLEHLFEDLAATGNAEEKRHMLAAVLRRCNNDREAAYLGKIVMGDLRTGVRDGNLLAAIAEAFERDEADVRRAALLIGALDAVVLRAKADTLAEAEFTLFHPIQFMLATPVETAELAAEKMPEAGFHTDDKLDGIRGQVHKDETGDGERLHIYTRTLDRTDASFPDVVDQLQKVSGSFLLDGEILPYKRGVVLPFSSIQKRLGRKQLTASILQKHPCVFVAFDILYRDGVLLMDAPLTERRAVLEDLAKQCGATTLGEEATGPFLLARQMPTRTADEIEAAFLEARAARNEGLILKDPSSSYTPGRRGGAWLKLKTHLPTLDCVVVAAEHGHGKRRDVLSDYTFAVWAGEPGASELLTLGKAYSGVTDAEIAELTTLFKEIATDFNGRVYQVKPQVVMEIAMDQVQRSDRHNSGYALRFPRIKRIRHDKNIEDADTLERVAKVYESESNFGQVEDEVDGQMSLFG